MPYPVGGAAWVKGMARLRNVELRHERSARRYSVFHSGLTTHGAFPYDSCPLHPATQLNHGSGFFQSQRFLGNSLGTRLGGLAACMEDQALVAADRPPPGVELPLFGQRKTRRAGTATGDLECHEGKVAASRGGGRLVIRGQGAERTPRWNQEGHAGSGM